MREPGCPNLLRFDLPRRLCALLGLLVSTVLGRPVEPQVAALPQGVRAVWSLDQAHREATLTRERVCLNGLWRWQPAQGSPDSVPTTGWGHFKVPGCWPGNTDYMQKDCQTIFPHPSWADAKLSSISAAWYEREITIPAEWTGRRISLSAEYVNSLAFVRVDGRPAGEIRFPGGETDLTAFCQPGRKHRLSVLVAAMPLKGVMLSYSDTFGARQVRGSVERRGLCGDVHLVGTPAQARLDDLKVSTSLRRWEVSFQAALSGLATDQPYSMRAEITDQGKPVTEFASKVFRGADLRDGKFTFTAGWRPAKLWDTHTPQNQYQVTLSLLDGTGRAVDVAWPERFGFRELWIEGRDFYLNGSRIFLCAVPLDNAQVGAAWATYAATRESLQRLKSFGINFVYTHNYGCEPGTHLSFAEILRAADDEGMLVSFSQPHFGQYQWDGADADRTNGYARDAEFYVRTAQNHPSVVFYSMSHNATGTEEAMNPDQIDGVHDARNQWSANGARKALRAEAIVHQLDSSRIVYHHSSGNLGSMHTANFYANFTPAQEMSDWFQHWADAGIKPLFLCEYGTPIFWDWMMYRGWYQGTRTFGSAQVPWELCLAEWDAQFLGSSAFRVTELEKECLRWEARQFQAGRLWHRWDYPRNGSESPGLDQRNAVIASYLTENIRAFRTLGVSAWCPWDHGDYWTLRSGVKRERRALPVDWEHLQQPGFSPDYIDGQMEWMNLSYDRADWIPTVAGQALLRNNRPLLAYLGGKPGAVTAKEHNVLPGETLSKQLILINNSRETVQAHCRWSFDLPQPTSGDNEATVETGQQVRVPLELLVPSQTHPGPHRLRATVHFSNGDTQADEFAIDVLPGPVPLARAEKVALFDPKGETAQLLRQLGLSYTLVEASADLSRYDLLIAGKGALSLDNPAPDLTRVREGLKVIVFEQTAEALEKRLGFRVAEYGLRNVFRRVPDHPLLIDLSEQHLHDWRGEATLLPARLKYIIGSRHAPEVTWCGIPVTRAWRAGNRGNVASVLIEKPARGDFLPVLDGGFGLEFSPLLEYHEGQGLVLFCQMDVTGRTEDDPAALLLVRNILRWVAVWKPEESRTLIYAGDPAGRRHLELAGFRPEAYTEGHLPDRAVVVIGPGAGKEVGTDAAQVTGFLSKGGRLVAIGLGKEEANSLLPFKVTMKPQEHIAAAFEPFGRTSPLAGISPAEVHNRAPRALPLVVGGATPVGDGVLAIGPEASVVFCQLAPWSFQGEQQNLRRTYRRTAFLLSRLLGNLGVASSTPLLENFRHPLQSSPAEKRWLSSYYLNIPQEWDDPYRFFCW